MKDYEAMMVLLYDMRDALEDVHDQPEDAEFQAEALGHIKIVNAIIDLVIAARDSK